MRSMKQVLIGVAFIGIIASLASALFFMMKGGQPGQPDDPKRASNMVRALAMRVGLSMVLFICILVAWKLGYIRPTGISAGA